MASDPRTPSTRPIDGKNHRKEKDAAHNLADAAERLAEVARRVPAAADLADPAVGLAGGV